MPTILKTKNSVTTTVAPTTLQQGELAVNITDKKMWVGNAATTPVQLLGDGGSGSFTTVNTTNLEVTNIKAKDGTASASIANSTGIFTHSTATVFTAGTVSAPAITTTGDTNTGIFFPAADTIAFTEGGTEAMRITSSANVGIGTNTPATILNLSRDSGLSTGTGTTVALRISDTGSDGGAGTWNTTQQFTSLEFSSADTSGAGAGVRASIGATMENAAGGASALTFFTNSGTNTERMRITNAGNVGIGTNSPAAGKFVVVGADSGNLGTFAGGTRALRVGVSASEATVEGVDSTGVTNYRALALGGGNYVRFLTGTDGGGSISERMRLDASGNLGLGVTPSAWGSSYKALQIGDSAFSNFGGQGYVLLSQNILFGASSNTYINTAAASYYRQYLGAHAFFTAPSGTAGNAITFTQAMTLDASGNLGVGTTNTVNSKLYVSNLNTAQLVIGYNNTSENYFDANLNIFRNATSSEAMRITSTGLVGIGLTNPGARLDISGNFFATGYARLGGSLAFIGKSSDLVSGGSATDTAFRYDGNNLVFAYSNTERMRIDSSGNVLIGKTSVTANGGDLQVSSGITFPATQVAKSDANTLDDYEEGTWTPVVADAETGGNVATSANVQGRYTKVGNLVTVSFEAFDINKTGMTAGNSVWIRGVPFVNNSSYTGQGVVDMRNTTFTVYPVLNLNKSSSAIRFFQPSSGGGVTTINVSNMSATTSAFIGTLTYFV